MTGMWKEQWEGQCGRKSGEWRGGRGQESSDHDLQAPAQVAAYAPMNGKLEQSSDPIWLTFSQACV